MTNMYELSAQHDARQSFYGKAHVITDDEGIILRSYSTNVASIKNGVAKVFGIYSSTTLRHIKEFLLQNAFKAENQKQILADYKV